MSRLIERVPDLREQVFERLRENINSGAIGFDERLTEMTVAKQFGVSRTPAREALALLNQAGLLSQDERGYRLPSFSRTDIDELFEVRRLIEPFAVRCVCRDASDRDLQALDRFAKSELARYGGGIQYVEANRRVRARLFELLKNQKLRYFVTHFEDRLAFIRVKTLQNPKIRRISVEGNKKLFAVVTRRNEAAAEAAMIYLLDQAHKAVVAML